MPFIKTVFDKSYDEIQLEDVIEFFKEAQDETITLEFKSGEKQLEDLYREVSAFLNTNGGLIIWGAPKEKDAEINNQKVKRAQGELVPTNHCKTREKLVQLINTNIVPAPSGIEVKQFTMATGFVYLIDIPRSLHPPHQVQESGTYCMRIDNIAKGAPHGFVEALFNYRRVPKLSADIIFYSTEEEAEIEVEIAIGNESQYPADKVTYIIEIYNAFDIFSDHKLRQVKASDHVRKFSQVFYPDLVIPKGIQERKSFRVVHLHRDILVSVVFWSATSNIDYRYAWFHPKRDTLVPIDHSQTQDEIIKQFIQELESDAKQNVNVPLTQKQKFERQFPPMPDIDEPKWPK
jgi:hypothetical protein